MYTASNPQHLLTLGTYPKSWSVIGKLPNKAENNGDLKVIMCPDVHFLWVSSVGFCGYVRLLQYICISHQALLERTGYSLDVTTGQRKYGGPPPESVSSCAQPGIGTEVFVGKIPRDLYEDELVPLFEKAGPIWDLRLMMDPVSGQNRGYAFITFCNKDGAQEAVKLCDNYEIRPGKHIGVCISVANNRLFVGSIPKNKTKENILEEFSKVTGYQEKFDPKICCPVSPEYADTPYVGVNYCLGTCRGSELK
ncbi:unnamed protein product [Ranitomeya imitator]|uniref:RRM domain-containing protein n=1 Tax=Ranitomeya imitator TaxID=111125 RepID=A0ABN9LME7_9NEOB|nr:unnamed protein product [Ranitomeya imitator]